MGPSELLERLLQTFRLYKLPLSAALALLVAWRFKRRLSKSTRTQVSSLTSQAPAGIYIDSSDRYVVVKASLKSLDEWFILSEGLLYLDQAQEVHIWNDVQSLAPKGGAVNFWKHARSDRTFEIARQSYQRICDKVSASLGPVGLVGDVDLTAEQLERLRRLTDRPVSLFDALRQALNIPSCPGRLSSLALVQSHERAIIVSADSMRETSPLRLVDDYPSIRQIVAQDHALVPPLVDSTTPPTQVQGPSFLAKGAAKIAGKEFMPMIYNAAAHIVVPISIVLGGQVTHQLMEWFPRPVSISVTPVTSRQSTIQVDLYRGSRPKPSDNLFIGTVTLGNLESTPELEITAHVYWTNWNVILSVQLLDVGTGRRSVEEFPLSPEVQTIPDRQKARQVSAEYQAALEALQRATAEHRDDDEALKAKLLEGLSQREFEDDSTAIILYSRT